MHQETLTMQRPPKRTDYPAALTKNLWVLGVYYFNLYLVQGTRAAALIEAGVSGMIDAAIRQLEVLKVEPDYLVVTHPHADHITGLNALMARYPGAQVVAGQGAREFAQHPKAVENMVREDRFISERLAALGLTPERAPISALHFPEAHIGIEHRHEIDLGGVQLDCRLVAGHSPGHIVVHIPALSALAPSDAIGFHYPARGILPIFLTDYQGYIQTLDRLAALDPEILCMAHQGPLTGPVVAEVFITARRAAGEMLDRIAAHRGDDALLADSLFRECYRDEFTIYSEENIRSVSSLLVRRAREYLNSH
jgi:2-aminobenzoylacetyl-CoA thioesterase